MSTTPNTPYVNYPITLVLALSARKTVGISAYKVIKKASCKPFLDQAIYSQNGSLLLDNRVLLY